MACTRKNCALAALWFVARFTTEREPETAVIVPTGGVLVRNMERFSLYYSYLTNTEKVVDSKSNFSYAARQNLDNHFVNMMLVGAEPGVRYFYNPYFLREYPQNEKGFISEETIRLVLKPWSKTLTRSQKDEYQQMWSSNWYVLKELQGKN